MRPRRAVAAASQRTTQQQKSPATASSGMFWLLSHVLTAHTNLWLWSRRATAAVSQRTAVQQLKGHCIFRCALAAFSSVIVQFTLRLWSRRASAAASQRTTAQQQNGPATASSGVLWLLFMCLTAHTNLWQWSTRAQLLIRGQMLCSNRALPLHLQVCFGLLTSMHYAHDKVIVQFWSKRQIAAQCLCLCFAVCKRLLVQYCSAMA